MDLTDLLLHYRVFVNGEMTIEGSVYREWYGFLFLLYTKEGNTIQMFNPILNEWVTAFP
jgi:hypothetical protein